MKGELKRCGNQTKLIYTAESLKNILSTVWSNLTYEDIKLWFDLGLLNELPRLDSEPEDKFCRQCNFIYRLSTSGLKWKRTVEFLNNEIDKPYCYNIKGLLYDVRYNEFVTREHIENKIIREKDRENYSGVKTEIDYYQKTQNFKELIRIRDYAKRAIDNATVRGRRDDFR